MKRNLGEYSFPGVYNILIVFCLCRFTYDFVELYTEYLALSAEEQKELRDELSEEGLHYFLATGKKVDTIHQRNKHKLHFPVNLNLL